MMEWTDRHERYFLRLISRRILLYTEMITTGAVLHGDRDFLLGFDQAEHPVALQLGGSSPEDLARAAGIGAGYGYDEVNLNVGCPSDRVQSGRFGACLMAEPELVARCARAMAAEVDVPVTVKCRIGIDGRERYEDLKGFVETVAAAGVRVFIVHARIAILAGLSPKENREIPPLRYEDVYRLKAELPALTIVINGGITNLDAAEAQLAHVDGVMIGRAAYQDPYLLSGVDRRFYGEARAVPSRQELVQALAAYAEAQRRRGVPLKCIARHVAGLFHGQRGARSWRRYLSEHAYREGAGPEVLLEALPREVRILAAQVTKPAS